MNAKRMFFILLAVSAWAASPARAEISFGLNVNGGGVESFYLDVSNYYQVPQAQVIMVRDRHIPDEEIPVVLFLATRAHVGPELIVQQRLGGRSWMDIALFYHLDPGIFYVPFQRDPGPPYGHAYGYYRHAKKNHWNKIRLGDADVVNFVNTRFVSEHYGYSPDEVARYRSQGGRFERVGRKGQGHDEGRGQDRNDGQGNNGHGKGRGKGHGKD
jgi:hypothetical protein